MAKKKKMAVVIRAEYRELSGIFDTPKRTHGHMLRGVYRLNRFKRRREFEPGIPKVSLALIVYGGK